MAANMLCRADKSLLLVIDVQEKLTQAMPQENVNAMLKNINTLLSASHKLNIPVLHSEQYPEKLGTSHPQIQELLPPDPVSKTCFSFCAAQARVDAHPEREQWILAGIETHICVTQTCMDLLAQNKTVFIIEDAVCSRRKANFKNGISRMRQAGAIITNTESVLFEWLGDASHEHFRELSRLIR